ncbi:MAG: hypothetical protein V1838_05475 [Patescibacteria group bacterium]
MTLNNKYIIIASVTVIIVFAVVRVIMYINNSDNPTEINNNRSFYYLTIDDEAQIGEIHKYIVDNEDQTIFKFSLPKFGSLPVASFDLDNSIFIDLGSDDSFYFYPSTGAANAAKENRIPATSIITSDGKRVAYNRLKEGADELTELIIKLSDGNERIIDSGSPYEIGVGMLKPIYWTADGQTLYAKKVHATEGDIIGLYSIDIQSLTLKRIDAIDELEISRYIFNEIDNVYGTKPIIRFSDDEEPARTIYRMSLDTHSITEFTLHNSGIDGLEAVDPSGRFIAYTYSMAEDGPGLWVYDTINRTEQLVISGMVPVTVLDWRGDEIIYLGNSIKGPTASTIYKYDLSTNSNITLVNKKYEHLQLIGWVNQ